MKNLFYILLLLGLSVGPVKGQAFFQMAMEVNQNPTCLESNGSITFIDSTGQQQALSLALYSHPDTILIGTGYQYTGLKQGLYLLKVINSWGMVSWESHYLGNFSYFNQLQFERGYLRNSTFPDTCSASKGSIRLAINSPQATRDSLSKIQWKWSNGQTGLNATNLKANQTHWVTASLGENCPYYFPPCFESNLETEDFNTWAPNLKNVRTHKDTLFFEIRNVNSLQVVFPFESRPNCENTNGVLVAAVPSGGTAPYHWKWQQGANNDTIRSIMSGPYAVRVTDGAGCEGLGNHFLAANQDPSLMVSSIQLLKSDSCFFSQGKARAIVQGGIKPYLYKWNNSNLSTDSTVDRLAYGFQNLSVSDSQGCRVNKSFFVPNQNAFQATYSVQSTDCEGKNGSVTITGVGGVEPYRMRWFRYPEYTGLHLDSLTGGPYYGYLEDANGCKTESIYPYLTIPPNCFRPLLVDLYLDEVGECIKQNSFLPVFNFSLRYKLLNTIYFSQSWGSQNQINLLPGAQEVNVVPIPTFTPACLRSDWGIPNLNLAPDETYLERSIGLGAEGNVLNFRPYLAILGPFRPGFVTRFELTIRNEGNKRVPASGAEITLPPNVYFTGSPWPHTQTAPNKVRFATNALPLGGLMSIFLDVKLDSSSALGIYKDFEVRLDTLPNESHVADNQKVFSFLTVGAYDPNDITVHPAPTILPTERELSYQIRFQNLGNFYAENVVLKDTLPDEIDMSTFSFTGSKHWISSMEIKGQVLTVRYLGIRLPAAEDSEPESHGYFRFTVRRKPNLMLGTRIRNSASIYFDFNAPVKTNVSETVIALPGTDFARRFSVYPNPGNEQFRIMDSDATEVQIFDLAGKRLGTLRANEDRAFPLTSFPNGLFYVRFNEDGKTYVEKLMVQKF